MKAHLLTLGLSLLLRIIAALPSVWVQPLSRILGLLAYFTLRRDRQLMASNVQRVYGLAAHSSYTRRLQKQVFQSQIAVLLETFKTNMGRTTPLEIEGMDRLAELIRREAPSGQSLIVITAHCGSWELVAGSTAKASGRRFYALAKPSKLPAFTQILARLRSRMNTEVLWTDNKNLLREMLRVLKSGDYLGFVMDQKPEGRIGPVVDFMGIPTAFVSGPAKLAIRQQCPVLAVFCMRTQPWRYRIEAQVIASAQHGLDDETALTQTMAQAIESCIRLYPEQWVWNYKRWRSPSQPTVATASAQPSHA